MRFNAFQGWAVKLKLGAPGVGEELVNGTCSLQMKLEERIGHVVTLQHRAISLRRDAVELQSREMNIRENNASPSG